MPDEVYKWQNYFKDTGISEQLIGRYIEYSAPLLSKNLPVIFEFSHLAQLLGREESHLASIINSTVNHYRTFSIPKRSGGKRQISSPYPSLLGCQRWILDNILYSLKIHNSAHGFVPKRSIITNARQHLSKNEMIKLDITNFFPSTKIGRVYNMFKSLGYAENVSLDLAKICTLNDELPQGAATSPSITNVLCYRMDKRIASYCRNKGIKYTRYADDLTFSGKKVPSKLIGFIDHVLKDEGYELNRKKIKKFTTGGVKLVTGLDVTGDRLRVPRTFRRDVKKQIYYISKYGLISHVKKQKITDPNYLEMLLGKISFWESVEGSSDELDAMKSVVLSSMKKFGPPDANVYF